MMDETVVSAVVESSTQEAMSERKWGVLVVDDDAEVRDLLGWAMTRLGMRVWRAADGRSALKMFWRNRECIDLVMLDIQMPVMDGATTFLKLRQLTTRVQCCFVSGDLG